MSPIVLSCDNIYNYIYIYVIICICCEAIAQYHTRILPLIRSNTKHFRHKDQWYYPFYSHTEVPSASFLLTPLVLNPKQSFICLTLKFFFFRMLHKWAHINNILGLAFSVKNTCGDLWKSLHVSIDCSFLLLNSTA